MALPRGLALQVRMIPNTPNPLPGGTTINLGGAGVDFVRVADDNAQPDTLRAQQ